MSKLHWVALATRARIGGKTLTRLLRHFGSLSAVLQADVSELIQVPYIGQQTARAIKEVDLNIIEQQLNHFTNDGIQVITWEDPDYPVNLLHCDSAPPVLFVKGKLLPTDGRAVAIVGTRQPGEESLELAHDLGKEMAARGWVVVSGLAIGIDTAAHQGALEAGGRTLAVLGSGLQAIYPQRNTKLADSITVGGAVLSEVHPEAMVSPQNLIARNRIASGLSKAVIVVQSGLNGGSMSTVRHALNQGRALYAVVGGGAGCDLLIEQGAAPLVPGQIDWDSLSAELNEITIQAPPAETGTYQPSLL